MGCGASGVKATVVYETTVEIEQVHKVPRIHLGNLGKKSTCASCGMLKTKEGLCPLGHVGMMTVRCILPEPPRMQRGTSQDSDVGTPFIPSLNLPLMNCMEHGENNEGDEVNDKIDGDSDYNLLTVRRALTHRATYNVQYSPRGVPRSTSLQSIETVDTTEYTLTARSWTKTVD